MAGYDEKDQREAGEARCGSCPRSRVQVPEAAEVASRVLTRGGRRGRRVRDMANLIISLRKAHTQGVGGRCVVEVAEAEVEAEAACLCAPVLTENIDCRYPSRGKGS